VPYTTERIVKKHFISTEVAENFTMHYMTYEKDILPSYCDVLVDELNNKLKTALDVVAQLKTNKKTNKKVIPWKTDLTMKIKRKCRSAERTWRKTKLEIHFNILTENLKNYNKEVKKITTSLLLKPYK